MSASDKRRSLTPVAPSRTLQRAAIVAIAPAGRRALEPAVSPDVGEELAVVTRDARRDAVARPAGDEDAVWQVVTSEIVARLEHAAGQGLGRGRGGWRGC